MFFRIFFVAILFSSMAFLNQCKKYAEDDVLIQWKRPEKRLIKYGPWVFDKLTVDGVDKSVEFRADSSYFNRLAFYHTENNPMIIIIERNNGFEEDGRFELFDKNKFLNLGVIPNYINSSDFHNYGPIFHTELIEWEILRLSKKGMTLKTSYNSSEYILYLKSSH